MEDLFSQGDFPQIGFPGYGMEGLPITFQNRGLGQKGRGFITLGQGGVRKGKKVN